MRHSLCQSGKVTDGSITKIRAAGFSGIAATTWAVAVWMTSDRLNVGAQCAGTLRSLKTIARSERSIAGPGNGRHFFTGPTIREKSE